MKAGRGRGRGRVGKEAAEGGEVTVARGGRVHTHTHTHTHT